MSGRLRTEFTALIAKSASPSYRTHYFLCILVYHFNKITSPTGQFWLLVSTCPILQKWDVYRTWNEQVSWLRKGRDNTISQYCNQLQKGLRFSNVLSLKWYYQTLHESSPLPSHPSCKDSKAVNSHFIQWQLQMGRLEKSLWSWHIRILVKRLILHPYKIQCPGWKLYLKNNLQQQVHQLVQGPTF